MKTQSRHLFLRHLRKVGFFLLIGLMIQKKTRSTQKTAVWYVFKKNENKKHKYSASKC